MIIVANVNIVAWAAVHVIGWQKVASVAIQVTSVDFDMIMIWNLI